MILGRVTSPYRVLPDFLIIGAQKSGTTSLYHYLAQHPDMIAALRKEVHYFDQYYERGPAWYRSFFPSRPAMARHQRESGHQALTGEATPYYLFHPGVPDRVRQILPAIKLIVLLRDPVARAYSHFHHEAARGREALSFADAVEAEERRIGGECERLLAGTRAQSVQHRHFSYVARGFYADQIENWYRSYDRSHFLFLKSEELYADPAAVLEATRRFLGLREFRWPSFPVFNPGGYDERIDSDTLHSLHSLYRPSNARLQDVTGMDFDWGY
jgi:hypothetical protein